MAGFASSFNPMASFGQGYNIGAGIRDDQLKQQQMLAAQDQERQLQADIQAVRDSANPAQGIADLALKYPRLNEQFGRAYDMMSAEQQQNRLSAATQVYAAIQNGQPQIAAKMMRDRAAAMKASGAADEAQSASLFADMIEQSPDAAHVVGGLMLARAMGPEKFATTFSTLGAEGRAQALAPADLAKANAEAGMKTAEADFAPQKYAADLGLTKAQTAQVMVNTRKLGAEVQKIVMDMESGGALDPEKRFDYESKLRAEYSKQTAGFQEARAAYARINASQNDAIGDLSMIYAYMKMLDPGSVVREGEFATAQNAGGIPERVWNIYNKVVSGERLTEGQRKGFRSQAAALMKEAEQQEKTVRGGLDRVVKSYHLNPDNVFYESKAQAPQGGAAAGSTLPPSLAGKGWAKY